MVDTGLLEARLVADLGTATTNDSLVISITAPGLLPYIVTVARSLAASLRQCSLPP